MSTITLDRCTMSVNKSQCKVSFTHINKCRKKRTAIDLSTGELLRQFENEKYLNACLSAGLQQKQLNSEKYKQDSLIRARRSVMGYCLSNQFNCFITLTFNDNVYINDPHEMSLKFRKCVDYLSRNGLKYVVVMERGKTTKRLHLHGFAYIDKNLCVDSGHKVKKNGKIIYNIPYFEKRLGWTTCVFINEDIDNQVFSALYCSKYINKDAVRMGNRLYLASKGLRKCISKVKVKSKTMQSEFMQILRTHPQVKAHATSYCLLFYAPAKLYHYFVDMLEKLKRKIEQCKNAYRHLRPCEVKTNKDPFFVSVMDDLTQQYKYQRKFYYQLSVYD